MLNTQATRAARLEFASADASLASEPETFAAVRPVLVNRIWSAAVVVGDSIACAVSTLIAKYIFLPSGFGHGEDGGRRAWMTALFLSCGVVFYLGRRGHYRHRHPFWTQARHVGFGSALALAVCYFSELVDEVFLPGILLSWCLLPFVVLGMRRLVRLGLERYDLWRIRILVVGDAASGVQAQTAIHSEAALGYEVAAVIDIRGSELPGHAGSWRALLLEHRAELLLIAVEDMACVVDGGIVAAALKERVPLAMMPFVAGVPVHGCEQLNFFSHDVMLLKFRNNLADPVAIALKRAFDLAITMVGFLFVSPIFILIALLVMRDGGPALFAHWRVGANGRAFRCLKFRTMVVNSDAVLRQTLACDPDAAREWQLTRKLITDPRVTRLGHLLRRSSLDELPQLLNIMRGDMSLVGPRPIVREEVVMYGQDIEFYYEAKPGLTGLWQVSGRSDTTYARRVELDVWYVKNWTAWHDLVILLMTFSAVVLRRGAR